LEKKWPSIGRPPSRKLSSKFSPATSGLRCRLPQALTELANAIEEEKRFIQPLLEQDRDFANALLPRPLSQAGIFETPELLSWMAVAKRLDLLNEQQAIALAVPEEAAVAIN